MKNYIIALIITFAIILSLTIQQSILAQAQSDLDPRIRDLVTGENAAIYGLNANGIPIVKGEYTVMLTNETFTSVDNDPKFADKDKVKASNIPEKNAKVDPYLKHEYEVKIGAIIYEKVRQYNGTHGNSLSPLQIQGGHVENVMSHAIRGFTIENVQDISIFANDPDIESVEEQTVAFPISQYYSLNGLRIGHSQIPTLQFKVDGIEGQPNVDIAVIDTPVLRSHPDLNVMSGGGCSLPSGTPCTADSAGPGGAHGTLVAGVVGAKDNLAGTVGVAAGARIWTWAVCGGSQTACPGNIAEVLDIITANAATYEIATMSIANTCGALCTDSLPTSSSIRTAINSAVSAGVTVFVGAGNDGINANSRGFCDVETAICVSANADLDGKCGGLAASVGVPFGSQQRTQRDDQRAYFSNFGTAIDLMASGTNIILGGSLSTATTSTTTAGQNPSTSNSQFPFIGASIHGSYGIFGGTSEATPWASGAGAALKALHPSWTPAQVKTDLQTNAIAQDAPCNSSTGLGGLANNPNSGSSEKILNLAAID